MPQRFRGEALRKYRHTVTYRWSGNLGRMSQPKYPRQVGQPPRGTIAERRHKRNVDIAAGTPAIQLFMSTVASSPGSGQTGNIMIASATLDSVCMSAVRTWVSS